MQALEMNAWACHGVSLWVLCRNVQLMPANAFGSMVHCLAVVGSDLWCCTGSGTIAVVDLVTSQIKIKVKSGCTT